VELGVPEAFLTWIGGPEKLNDAMLSAQRLKLEAAAQPAALPRVGPAPALGTQPGPFSEEDVRRLIREQVDAAVAAGLKPAALTSEPKPGEPRGVRGLLRRLRAKG